MKTTITLLAVFAIIASIGLLTVATVSTLPTSVAFANGDKCISGQKDSLTFTACSTDKKSPFLSGDAKKQCRETFDKCSSSQTGFGKFGNFFKP